MDLQHQRLLLVQKTEPYRNGMQQGTLSAEQLTMLEGLTTWSFQIQEVGVLGCTSDEIYNQTLDTGVRVIGCGFPKTNEQLFRRIADFCPTHIAITDPEPALFRWAVRQQMRCIGLFQEPLQEPGLKQRWDNYQLSRALNHSGVEWVGGFGLDTCEALAHMGVLRDKLIPWSWPPSNRAEVFQPKHMDTQLETIQLMYVGPILATKGVGDLLIAIAHLKAQGLKVQLKLVGQGDIQRFEIQARRLLLLDQVEFLEHIPDHSLVYLIRQADLVVMPSRHESLENSSTILNHCLQSHTPIVASDHPMFAGSLSHGVNAIIFPAGNTRALAQGIAHLVNNPETYAKLSAASQLTWQALQLPVHWISLVDHWLQGTRDGLQPHTLSAAPYRSQSPSQLLQPT